MKPTAFEYVKPASVAEVCQILSENPDAKVLAGGQSLIPLMNFRLVRPSLLIDLAGLDRLQDIRVDNGSLTIGAMTTHRTVEQDPDLVEAVGIVHDALPLIGHPGIRNMGTVGGSLAHADPAAEWAAIVLVLNGQIHAEGVNGTRSIPASQFFEDWMSTSLEPNEIITAVSLDIPPPRRSGSALVEISRRTGDFAMAGVGAFVEVDGGVVVDARLATIGLDMTPRLCQDAADVLHSKHPTTEVIAEAADAIMTSVQPLDDQHATAVYKRKVSGVLTQRALYRAVERIGSADG